MKIEPKTLPGVIDFKEQIKTKLKDFCEVTDEENKIKTQQSENQEWYFGFRLNIRSQKIQKYFESGKPYKGWIGFEYKGGSKTEFSLYLYYVKENPEVKKRLKRSLPDLVDVKYEADSGNHLKVSFSKEEFDSSSCLEIAREIFESLLKVASENSGIRKKP